jgi:hypothetical protein
MKLETAQLKFSINKWWNLENITGETLKKKKNCKRGIYCESTKLLFYIYICMCVADL